MLRAGIWFGPITLLLIALSDMPYGYYQLLRVIMFCASVYIAIQEKERSDFWLWAFAACALTYNPIFSLSLGREIWPLMNVLAIVLYGLHFWVREKSSIISRGE